MKGDSWATEALDRMRGERDAWRRRAEAAERALAAGEESVWLRAPLGAPTTCEVRMFGPVALREIDGLIHFLGFIREGFIDPSRGAPAGAEDGEG